METHWLASSQVQKYEEKSERWVRDNALELGAACFGRQRNGNPITYYHAHRMSPEAQLRWAREQKVVAIPTPQEQAEAETVSAGQLCLDLVRPDGQHLPPEQLAQAEGRYRAIAPLVSPEQFRKLWQLMGGSKDRVAKHQAKEHGCGVRTIYLWLARWEGKKILGCEGLPALVDRARRDKGRPRILNDAAADLLVALQVPDKDRYSLSLMEGWRWYDEDRIWRDAMIGRKLDGADAQRLKHYLDGAGRLKAEAKLPEISYETFRYWAQALPESFKTVARLDRERFFSAELPLSHRDYESMNPLDFVVMDHRQLDIFCMLPAKTKAGWRLARPWVTAAIDMRTRKWLSWLVCETPNSETIATVLKRLLLEHGRPKRFYWDNGQDFECDWMDGVLASLNVKVTHSIVKRARSKMIEPAFGALSDFERSTQWWVGHKSEARPDTLADLVKVHERWTAGEQVERPFLTLGEVREVYHLLFDDINNREHSGRGMRTIAPDGYRQMTPNQCWDKLIVGVPREVMRRDVLMFMFRDRREVQVRNGQIALSFGGEQFIYQPSADDPPEALLPFNGETADVRIDKQDLERVAVFMDGRFVCVGQNLALRKMGEEQFKEDERERRTQYRKWRELVHTAQWQVGLAGPVERLRRRADARASGIGHRAPGSERPEVLVAFPEAQAAVAAGGGAFRFAEARAALEVTRTLVEDDPETEFKLFD